MNENYVINLGRQLGSGGKEIGEKLAKEFGIAFYDKELIKLASDESGLCKEFFEKADERASQSIIGGLFGTRFPFISDGKNATVMFGMIKTTVKIDRLERSNISPSAAQKSTAKSTFVSSETQDRVYEKKLNFKQDIDVRGMRGDEAIQAVTYFIDDAILLGMSRVRILHGTGTGILRTLIRNYLSTVSGIAHYQDEHVQFGGAGITVVDLE